MMKHLWWAHSVEGRGVCWQGEPGSEGIILVGINACAKDAGGSWGGSIIDGRQGNWRTSFPSPSFVCIGHVRECCIA